MKPVGLLCVLLFLGCRSSPLTEEQQHAAEDAATSLEERLGVMPQIARHKVYLGLPVDDLQRERDVLEAMRIEAKRHGLDPDFIESVFKAQIEAGKILQRRLMKELPLPQPTAEGMIHARDQLKMHRLQIDEVNTHIIESLAKLNLASPDVRGYLRERIKLELGGYADDVANAAIAPFTQSNERPPQ